MIVVCCPKSPKGSRKRKTVDFRKKSEIGLRLKKVCYKVSLCENCQRQSCQAFIGLTNRAKWLVGATPSTWNFGSKWPRCGEIAHFRFLFARSNSAVTPSEKSSININKNPLRAFRWAQDEHHTLSLSPPKGTQKCSVQKFELSCDNSEMVGDRMSVTIDQ